MSSSRGWTGDVSFTYIEAYLVTGISQENVEFPGDRHFSRPPAEEFTCPQTSRKQIYMSTTSREHDVTRTYRVTLGRPNDLLRLFTATARSPKAPAASNVIRAPASVSQMNHRPVFVKALF